MWNWLKKLFDAPPTTNTGPGNGYQPTEPGTRLPLPKNTLLPPSMDPPKDFLPKTDQTTTEMPETDPPVNQRKQKRRIDNIYMSKSGHYFIAVCNDGTVFKFNTQVGWKKLPDLPQD